MKYLYLIVIILISITTHAQQSSLTKYNLNATNSSNPSNFCSIKDSLFFSANDGINGYEPWYMDANNTPKLLKNFASGNNSSLHSATNNVPHHLLATSRKLFMLFSKQFTLPNWQDGAHCYDPSGSGQALFITPSNGNENDVFDTYKDSMLIAYHPYLSSTGIKTMVGVFTQPPSPFIDTLYSSKDFNVKEMQECDNRIYMAGEYDRITQGYYELYCINRQTKSVTPVHTHLSSGVNRFYHNMVQLNGYLYYSIYAGNDGFVLCRHDGTSPATYLSVRPGRKNIQVAAQSNIICAFNGKVYFSGTEKGHANYQLYVYDPATDSISLIPNVWHSQSSQPQYLTVYHNKLFYSCYDSAANTELYVYDGTNPPYIVADINQGTNGSVPQDLFVYKDDLFFSALGADNHRELYRYNDSSLKVPVFPISVQNVEQTLTTTLYPNPTTGDAQLEFTLHNPQTLSVQITDMNGRIVYDNAPELYSTGNHHIFLPLNSLTNGLYLYNITNNKGEVLSTGRVNKL